MLWRCANISVTVSLLALIYEGGRTPTQVVDSTPQKHLRGLVLLVILTQNKLTVEPEVIGKMQTLNHVNGLGPKLLHGDSSSCGILSLRYRCVSAPDLRQEIRVPVNGLGPLGSSYVPGTGTNGVLVSGSQNVTDRALWILNDEYAAFAFVVEGAAHHVPNLHVVDEPTPHPGRSERKISGVFHAIGKDVFRKGSDVSNCKEAGKSMFLG